MNNNKKTKRREFKGDVVVSGIASGEASILGMKIIQFPMYWIHDGEIKTEKERFFSALKDSKNQLERLKSKICQIQGREQITILDSHVLLLQDELLVKNTVNIIEKDHINAEWALHRTIDEIKQAFSKINQSYIKERKYDIDYIENAIYLNLQGKSQDLFQKVPKGAIVVATNLSPAETLHIIRYHVSGFITETGGFNTHTSIVARSLGIPSIIVSDGKILEEIHSGDKLILDGNEGRVILHPHKREQDRYLKKKQSEIVSVKEMKREAQFEAKTIDNKKITILANMELLDEIDMIKDCGAQGIGLYRTEFLFLDKEALPGIKEQEENYKTVIKKMGSEEVIIRTVDLGAEKIRPEQRYNEQPNPALGLRAIRFCMRERKIFSDQLMALINASEVGPVKICFPLISSLDEFIKVKKFFCDILNSVKKQDQLINGRIKLGIMIETPSAALEMDLLAEEVDFFSVGTNDLVQYLLAVDRSNDLVSYLYTPLHPSVIRILKHIADVAKKYQKEVTICGEMAADPMNLLVLLALGYTRLSMNAASIPKINKMIRMTSMDEANVLLNRVLMSHSHKESYRMMQGRMKDHFPDFF